MCDLYLHSQTQFLLGRNIIFCKKVFSTRLELEHFFFKRSIIPVTFFHNSTYSKDIYPFTLSCKYYRYCVRRAHLLFFFRIQFLLCGISPFYFHVVNVLVHAAVTSILVWTCSNILYLPGMVPLLTGLLFAVHPIHVEAVSI